MKVHFREEIQERMFNMKLDFRRVQSHMSWFYLISLMCYLVYISNIRFCIHEMSEKMLETVS